MLTLSPTFMQLGDDLSARKPKAERSMCGAMILRLLLLVFYFVLSLDW